MLPQIILAVYLGLLFLGQVAEAGFSRPVRAKPFIQMTSIAIIAALLVWGGFFDGLH